MENSEINRRFDYHAPESEFTVKKHEYVRARVKDLALLLNDLVPEGREKALAFTALEEVLMWTNAGIARNQNGTDS